MHSSVRRVVMLTGDSEAAGSVGREVGVDEVISQLLPDAKVDAVWRLQRGGVQAAMVGDGINGGGRRRPGTEAAIEAADVALMTDDLGRIADVRLIARQAYRTIQQTLF